MLPVRRCAGGQDGSSPRRGCCCCARSSCCPAHDPLHDAAETKAKQLRDQLLSLQEAQALTIWLDRRLQLGRDVFARGAPEPNHHQPPAGQEGDRIGFLWACLGLFEEAWPAGTAVEAVYAPKVPDLFSVEEARVRVRERLADHQKDVGLEALVPDEVRRLPPAQNALDPEAHIRRRSAWTSTLVACLEMAKQGEVSVEQVSAETMPMFTRTALGSAAA